MHVVVRRLPALGFLVLAGLLVGTIWFTPYLPTNDGPEWVFASHMENHYGDTGTMYQSVFVPATQFAYRGFTLFLTPFSDVLGWQNGLRLALTVAVLMAAAGLAVLVRTVNPKRAALGFLAFPLALTWHLYMGFFAFGVGTALGFFILALAVRCDAPTRRERAILSALLLMQAVAHVFTAVLTGLAIFALFEARAPRGQKVKETLYVAVMGLPAAGILLATWAMAHGEYSLKSVESFAFMPVGMALSLFPRTLMPGPEWRANGATMLILAAAVVVARRVFRKSTDVTDRVLGGTAFTLLLLGVFAPLNLPNWQFFSQRFVPLGAALLIASIPLEEVTAPLWDGLVRLGLFVVAAICLLASYPFHSRLVASCKDALAGLESPVRRQSDWLPVTLQPEGAQPRSPIDREVPFSAPLRHIEALYATVEGGLTPYYFALSGAVYPFTMRSDAPRPPPVPDVNTVFPQIDSDAFVTDTPFRQGVEGHLATFGMFYEGVVVTGARPDDLVLWKQRGYLADWQEGSTLIAHFAPCLVDVVIPASRIDPPPKLDISVADDPVVRDSALPVTVEGEAAHLVVKHGPCGTVWVRPHWDGSTKFCSNADRDGRIAATITRTQPIVLCKD